jgi:hypothetical protein
VRAVAAQEPNNAPARGGFAPGGIADAGRAAAIAVAVFGVLAVLFYDTPVLTEARDYLVYDGFIDTLWGWRAFLLPEGRNVRVVSMLVFAAEHRTLGLDHVAINLVQEALIGAGAGLLYIHLRQLAVRPSLAASGALLWCLSYPVLDAAHWQATQHDKLAFLFILLALIANLAGLRGQLRPVWSNLLVGSAAILAVNSKEIGFVLLGALPAQALLVAAPADVAARRVLRHAGLPLVYLGFYLGLYRGRLDPIWQSHIGGGDRAWNLLRYAALLLGAVPFAWRDAAAIGAAALAGVAAAMLWLRRLVQSGTVAKQELRPLLYLALLAAGSLALMLGALSPAGFYLLLPASCVLGMAMVVLEQVARHEGGRRAALGLAVPALIILVQAGLLLAPSGPLGTLRAEGQHLSAGFRIIAARTPPHGVDSLVFVFPEGMPNAFYFFRGGSDGTFEPLLSRFIYADGRHLPIAYTEQPAPAAPGSLQIVWDAELRLREIALGEQSLYP